MREMFKEYLFRTSKLWLRFGLDTKIGFAILLGIILMLPHPGYGQGLLGDPSSTLGQWGKFKVEAGVGFIYNPNIKIDGKPYSVTSPQGKSYNLIATETSETIKSEQRFLTATLGLGSSVDAFLKVGQFKIQDLFDGNYGPSGGLGFRFSPPQTGFLKIGFQMQGFYATSENDGYNTSVDFWSQTDSKGLHYHVDADGTAKNKLRLISYDMVLGVGVQDIPYVRPYAGLLVSLQNRTEKGSFSGQGNFTICTSVNCIVDPGSISLSWNTDLASDSIFGGVFGLTITPIERVGITFEGQLGEGHLGNQYGFMASAFVNF